MMGQFAYEVIRVGPCDPYPISGKEGRDVCDSRQRDAAGTGDAASSDSQSVSL